MAEGMFYNVTGGYVEGIVRGYRNTLLTGQNYGNLTQVSRSFLRRWGFWGGGFGEACVCADVGVLGVLVRDY